MNIQTPKPQRTPVWLNADSGNFEPFRQIVGQTSNPVDTPHAAQLIRNIPIYEGADPPHINDRGLVMVFRRL